MNKLKDTRVFGDLIVDDSITKNNKEVATEEYVDIGLSAKQDKLTLDSGQVLGRTASGTGEVEAIDTTQIPSWAMKPNKPTYDYSDIGGTKPPTNAQKNSDITKAEIEAKLTGPITSHTHSYNNLSNKPTIPTIPSVMTTAEGNTGTATTQRTINAANLKSIILNHSPAGSRPASDVKAWAKKSSLAIEDIPTGTTGTTVALGNHTHSQYLTSFTETDPTVPSWAKTAAPSAVRFMRMNENNTITWRTAAQLRSDIGAGTSNLTIGTGATNAKAGNWKPSYSDITGLAENTVLGNPTSNPGAADTIPLINIDGLLSSYATTDYVDNKIDVLTKIWTGTQAQYDAIGTKDANTLYFII
jgi:hypothetical protein